MDMDKLAIFSYGFLGSVAVELVKLLRRYDAGKRMPARYYQPFFWVLRVALALIAGALAVVFAPNTGMAIYIGASAPLIIENFAREPPENIGGDDPNTAQPTPANSAPSTDL